ncbi:MAG: TnsA endonuclease N-terminal domain-containing protein [Gammaproteobacteria bacterium]
MTVSQKAGRLVAHESKLERSFIVLAEFLPTVRIYEEQPVSVPYVGARGQKLVYHPDFLVEFSDEARRPALVEIKPISALKKHAQKFRYKFEAASAFARRQGWRFLILTDRVIEHPLVTAAHFLLPFRRGSLDVGHAELLLKTLEKFDGEASVSLVLDELVRLGCDRPEATRSVWIAAANFTVGCRFDSPLTMSSLISLPDRSQPLPRIRGLS